MAKAKKTQEVGFSNTFENLINDGTLTKTTEEVIETNGFGFYMNSVQKVELIDIYNDLATEYRNEFIEKNPKLKTLSNDITQCIRSMAVHSIFGILDTALDNEEHPLNQTAYLLLNNYFHSYEATVAGVSASISRDGNEIESDIFKLKLNMNWDKAYNKMLKWYVKPEATDYQVPQTIKFSVAKIKQHLDIYMWEEFLKQEYYTAKLVGLDDADIIDLFDSSELIMKFCKWCEGYEEGVNEDELELTK